MFNKIKGLFIVMCILFLTYVHMAMAPLTIFCRETSGSCELRASDIDWKHALAHIGSML